MGRKVGRLIVIKQVDDYIGSNGKHYDQWMCECSCEDHNIVILRGSNIRGQRTLSCGCLRKEVAEVIHLGYFDNKDDAIKARLYAEQKYFKEFAPQKHLYEQYGIIVENKDDRD